MKARFTFTLWFIFCLFTSAFGQVKPNKADRVLYILHTNDIHDHLRSDVGDVGGLPYVAGFIHHFKAKHCNVLTFDAGDVAMKGDLVAEKTHSKLAFEAMRQVGYTTWTPGNHDLDLGMDSLLKYSKLANMDRLCINLLKTDESHVFTPYKIYIINGIRVGVIGATLPGQHISGKYHVLNFNKTAQAIAAASEKLKPKTDIIVVLAHIPPGGCIKIARMAPHVNVFISGHSHTVISKPIQVPDTKALILQAGCYARYVGRLRLTVNINKKQIDSWDYKLVRMNHKFISPDVNMLEWVREQELKLAPIAQKIVGWAPRALTKVEVGVISAAAEREATSADVAFDDGVKVLREGLPAGKLDVNTIYLAAGKRDEQLIEVNLSGSQINHYVQGLRKSKWHQTQWAGFTGSFHNGQFKSSLNTEKHYQVVMTQREWKKRFVKIYKRSINNLADWREAKIDTLPHPRLLKISWLKAMLTLLKKWNQIDIDFLQGLHNIENKTGQNWIINYR
jgi:2',3'-cyclic-nucleotide 2'-phosphodiesterase (5'-nucleotidase family)